MVSLIRPFFFTSSYAAPNSISILSASLFFLASDDRPGFNPILPVAKYVRYRMQGLEIVIDFQRSSRLIFRNKHLGLVDQYVQMVPLCDK